MDYAFKGIGWKILCGMLLGIPLGAVIAGIFWFFAHVLFGYPANHLVVWKWTYVVLMGLLLLTNTRTVISRVSFGLDMAQKYNAEPRDVLVAYLDHGLTEEDGYLNWTPEEFQKWLAIKQTAANVADAMVKALRR